MTDYSTELAPGPWAAKEGYKGSGPWDRLTIEDANGNVLAVVNRALPSAHMTAGAMAATRDMLAALQEIEIFLTSEPRATKGGCVCMNEINLVRAAISKATKGAPIEAPEGYIGPPLPPRFPSDRMG